ncbi:MAG: serine/threonine protein kinase [Blastocatellia bacterium]|nr:serine/threonine protein kinase [Blastocatellia bacterium]
MNAQERHRQVQEVFNAALDHAPQTRGRFLEEACSGDQELRREVALLLGHDHPESGFFHHLHDQIAADLPLALAAPQPDKQLPAAFGRPFGLLDLVGETLDEKYRIDRQLGRGGMGAVYQATHLHTKRLVALKVISPEFAHQREFVERFRREAEAAGRLRHPNVVNVTDFGLTALHGQPVAYLVMEYLDGTTLKKLLAEKQQLPISLVADILEQTCLAIEKAHEQNIIHRDLKPDNIWLEPDGRGGYHVKVLDFGIAKLLSGSAEPEVTPHRLLENRTQDRTGNLFPPAVATEATTCLQEKVRTDENQLDFTEGGELTRLGTVMGTPTYMSPEQCQGAPVDYRTDIYSLGVIVYEMLAGKPPFQGNLNQLIGYHQHNLVPSLRKLRPDVPFEVEEVVNRTLEKNPNRRFASAAAFAETFRANAEDETTLLQRIISVYNAQPGAFVRLSLLFLIPEILVGISFLSMATRSSLTTVIPNMFGLLLNTLLVGVIWFVFFLAKYLTLPAFVPLVMQTLATPSSPVEVASGLGRLVRKVLRVLPDYWLPTSIIALGSFFVALVWSRFDPAARQVYADSAGVLDSLTALMMALSFSSKKARQYQTLPFLPLLVEGLSGEAAADRSHELTQRFKPFYRKNITLASIIRVGALILNFALIWLSLRQLSRGFPNADAVIGLLVSFFGIALSSVVVIFTAPIAYIAQALIYLKVRQANGEGLPELFRETGK